MSEKEPTTSSEDGKKDHEKKYHYLVDGKEYTTSHSSLTGAQIKAMIPDFDPSFQLVLEGHKGEPDKVIPDTETVNLDVHPIRHFYTVPPATFGCR